MSNPAPMPLTNTLNQQIFENLNRVYEENSISPLDATFARLILKIRVEEEKAGSKRVSFGDEISELLPDLRGFARSLTRNADSAEDLVQETIIKALSNTDKFQVGTSLRSWLFTILRNQFYSSRRKTKWEVSDTDGAEALKLVQMPNQDAHVALREFRTVFEELPVDQREALMLIGVAGFSYEEAAKTCACAVGTLKSRVNRGRARLTDVLGTPEAICASNYGITSSMKMV